MPCTYLLATYLVLTYLPTYLHLPTRLPVRRRRARRLQLRQDGTGLAALPSRAGPGARRLLRAAARRGWHLGRARNARLRRHSRRARRRRAQPAPAQPPHRHHRRRRCGTPLAPRPSPLAPSPHRPSRGLQLRAPLRYGCSLKLTVAGGVAALAPQAASTPAIPRSAAAARRRRGRAEHAGAPSKPRPAP